jgi:hypothetical protein
MAKTHLYPYDCRKFPLTIARSVSEVDEEYKWDDQGAEPPFLTTTINTKLLEESRAEAHEAMIIIGSSSVEVHCDGLRSAPLSPRLLNLIFHEATAIRTHEAYMEKNRASVPRITRRFLAKAP